MNEAIFDNDNNKPEDMDKTEQSDSGENDTPLVSPYDKSDDSESRLEGTSKTDKDADAAPQAQPQQTKTVQHEQNSRYSPTYSPYEKKTQSGTPYAAQQSVPYNNVPVQQPVGGNPYGTQQVGGTQGNTYYGAYGYTQDYTGGAYYGGNPPKKPMSKPLKAFLGTIAALSVVFLVAFAVENAQAYDETGGFDFDDFINSYSDDYSYDYGFGFDFGFDTDSDSGGGRRGDSGVWSDIDSSDRDEDSDAPSTEVDNDIVDAPDSDTVVNADAEIITAADQPTDLDSGDYTAQKAYKAIESSVVGIVTYENDVGLEDEATGEGSGIIITEDGYIVTNSHVISDTKDIAVEVILNDDTSYVAAIVGYDSRTDIAVLKIDAAGLTPVTFVDSDQVEVGQDALAVGNPGGIEYSNSLTRGTVSAVNRVVSSSSMVTYIQTDAAINPGNSGGPLMNIAGQVMGINTIKIVDTEYEGMGFAIPSNTVIEIANDLMTQGYVSGRVRIGITGEAISSYVAALYNVPEGILIDSFADDSPFVGTDAKEGDIITAIDGEEVTSFSEVYAILERYSPGDTVTVSLYRSDTDEALDVEIVLAEDKGETQQ